MSTDALGGRFLFDNMISKHLFHVGPQKLRVALFLLQEGFSKLEKMT